MAKWDECKIGDIFEWGHYPQSAEGEIQPITWVVLGRSKKGILALAQYGLDSRPYNDREQPTSWATCELRRWLNGEFLEHAFTEEERQALMLTEVYNDDNEDYDTPAGEDTEDRVFLLSVDEAEEFCDSVAVAVCQPTAYALKNGVEVDNFEGQDLQAGCWWWLRSPGCDASFAMEMGAYGEIGEDGTPAHWWGGAVRPAIQLPRHC